MKKQDFYFDLPEELIAQYPLEDRTNSRLMVIDKESGSLAHHQFSAILDYLQPGDCLVINDTRVLPARIYGKKDTGAKVEFLLLEKTQDEHVWKTMVKPGKKAKIGASFTFGDGLMTGEIVGHAEEGLRLVKFTYDGIFEEILDQVGQMPLPPYIKASLEDQERYQTVYARATGSAAAPTAGLHFTKDLLKQLEEKGIILASVTLHVGLGTFRPVKVDNILDHPMHSEYYELTDENAKIIRQAKEAGGRLISVGTTSTRTLESVMKHEGEIRQSSGHTDIFIYPGYEFQAIDGLITNFHLPESTLIMLVSALLGRENTLHAYEEAIKERYRFFSFGDAMLII